MLLFQIDARQILKYYGNGKYFTVICPNEISKETKYLLKINKNSTKKQFWLMQRLSEIKTQMKHLF